MIRIRCLESNLRSRTCSGIIDKSIENIYIAIEKLEMLICNQNLNPRKTAFYMIHGLNREEVVALVAF